MTSRVPYILQRTLHFIQRPFKYHFIRSVLEDGQLKQEMIQTSQNPADILTKVVIREKLKFCSV